MSESPPKATSTAKPVSKQRASFVFPLIVCLILALALVAAIFQGVRSRSNAAEQLAKSTHENAIPIVSVVQPMNGSAGQEIVLPGGTQAYSDAAIYARTNGYLKKWYFDIGARVKQGDLLAEIETPEIDQQLQQAESDVNNAEANLHISQITAKRYEDLGKSNSVSKQEVDQTSSDLTSKQAIVHSSQANLRRLQDLQSFEKIYAPFDGVITTRNTDIGALIQAGTVTNPKELFHLSAINELRVYVAVPEVYAPMIRAGDKVNLTSEAYPGRIFTGTLARDASSIDAQSRTLNVEVDVDNAKRQLLPGAYVFVHIPVPANMGAVTIPANTLLFRSEGLRVGVVRDGKVVLVPIDVGHDYGNTIEVVTGLTSNDEVILDPADSLAEGAVVQVKRPKAP